MPFKPARSSSCKYLSLRADRLTRGCIDARCAEPPQGFDDKEWTGVMAMSDVVVPMVESCLLLVFGIMMYRGKLTGLLAGMSLLSGERLKEAKRTAETLGVNRMMGVAIVFSAICLFLSSLFPDKRAILGLMVAAVILAALAYANRGPIRMYIKVKWNPGHRSPR